MRVSTLVILTILTVILRPGTLADEAQKELVRANNEFASRFYQVMTWDNDDADFIFCPLCLTTTLTMLSLGSNGQMTDNIYATVGFTRNDTASILEGYHRLVSTYTKQVKPTRAMFNGIFLSEDVQVEPSFLENLDKYFNAKVHYFNPTAQRKGQVLKAIQKQLNLTAMKEDPENSDYEDVDGTSRYKARPYTNGLSPPNKPLNYGKDEIILANYLDFKAGWEKKFDFINTKAQPFYVSNSEILSVSTMRQTGHFYMKAIPELDAQALAIPYLLCDGSLTAGIQQQAGSNNNNRTLRSKKPPRKKKTCKSGIKDSRLQMVLLLPNSQDGLSALERKLTRESLLSIPGRFDYKTYLDLRMPVFQMSSMRNVAELSSMLLGKPENQDFSRLAKNRALKLGRTFHRVSITVNERGSRTKSSLLKGQNPWTHPKIVRVDHPFLAFIHDKKTDMILVVLRVSRPQSPP